MHMDPVFTVGLETLSFHIFFLVIDRWLYSHAILDGLLEFFSKRHVIHAHKVDSLIFFLHVCLFLDRKTPLQLLFGTMLFLVLLSEV